VYLNRAYKRSIPRSKSTNRPDVLIKYYDGKVDVVEVQSYTDNYNTLINRNRAVIHNHLPSGMRPGTIRVVKPK
jgi:hypothetical protein